LSPFAPLRLADRVRRRTVAWSLAFVAVGLFTLLAALNVHVRTAISSPPSPGLWTLFLAEVPVWYGQLALAPLVYAACRRLPLRGPAAWRNAALQVLLAVPAIVAAIVIVTLGRLPVYPAGDDSVWMIMLQYARGYSGFFLLNYCLIAATCYAFENTRRAGLLAATLEQAKLAQLANQLQPHFLFNALHGVSALMDRDASRARSMLAQLTALLHSSLEYPEAQLVPLRVELAWVEAYASTQELRFAGRLRVSLPEPGALDEALCPRFLLQPLVENAIEHAGRPGPLRIAIAVREEGGQLSIRVSDDGRGFEVVPPAPGIGIGNLIHRLEMLFSGGASVRFANTSPGGAVVEIRLPLRFAAAKWQEPPAA